MQAVQLNNALALILPHHPPEIIHSRLEGTLRGYVGTTLPVPLKVVMNGIWAENSQSPNHINCKSLHLIVAYIDKAGIDVVRAMSCC